jgi:hypothetical protein
MNPIVYDILTKLVIPFTAALLLALIPFFVHRLISYFEKKLGMEMSAENKAALDSLVEKGVLLAEQKGVAAMKRGEVKPGAQEKADTAVNFVIDMIKVNKLDELAKDKIMALIEAKLAEKKADGTMPALPASTSTPAAAPAPAEQKPAA